MIKKCLKETDEVLEHELKNAKNLYKSKCINWKGKTLDSKEYYTEVISRELLKGEKLVLLEKINQVNRGNYNVDTTHNGQHNGDTNRAEEIFAIKLKGKKLEKLGLVIEYQVPLKEKSSDDAGKIDLVTSTNKSVYIVELKYIGNKETLLRAILEIWTYYKQLNKVNFLNSFNLMKQNKAEDIKKAVLLSVGCNAYKEAKELNKRPELKQLAKALDVDIFLLEENGKISYPSRA
jgi:Holliday junction resolvase-like predicted endonuclease